MSNGLTNLIVGLERMADEARWRGEDLRYTQQAATYEHLKWLDQMLDMVEKVRTVMLDERKRFMPVEDKRPAVEHRQDKEPVPKFLKQGPVKEPV